MRAALYARVSSREQRDRHTIDSQLRELPEFARREGWTIVATYVDDGRSASSGKLEKREGFTRLLNDAGAKIFDVVMVVDINRLTRAEDHGEVGLIISAFQRSGVAIWAPDIGRPHRFVGGLDDILVFVKLLGAAEDNKRRKSAFARGVREAVHRGRKARGVTPYGYTWTGSDKLAAGWGVHEERAAIVRELFKRVVAGESCRALGFELETRGVAPPRGGRWSVTRVITSQVYRGVYTVDGKQGMRVDCPRLIDDATWYAAQAQLAKSQMRGLRRTKHVYLCEGLLVCALCGAKLYIHGEAKDDRGQREAYYICSQRRRPHPEKARCELPMKQTHKLDQLVWDQVVAFLSQPRQALLERLGARRRAARAESSTWAKDITEHTAKLAELEQAEEAVVARFTRGMVSERVMDAALRDIGARRASLKQQIATARAQVDKAQRSTGISGLMEGLVDQLRARLESVTLEDKRAIVRALVPAGGVKLSPADVRVRLVFNEEGARAVPGIVSHLAPCTAHDHKAPKVELRVLIGRAS